jgi:hypothetical protein
MRRPASHRRRFTSLLIAGLLLVPSAGCSMTIDIRGRPCRHHQVEYCDPCPPPCPEVPYEAPAPPEIAPPPPPAPEPTEPG